MSEAIEAISGVGSSSAAEVMLDYAIAMTRKAMETQEDLADGLIEMMTQPQQTQPLAPLSVKGEYIDTYA